MRESNGTDTIWYYYDAVGSVTGFELNGVTYYYVKNIQGDIIAIVDETGAKVVEYTYDSWGKLISTTGTLVNTVGEKNPYRYRGYRYDAETGLYYLNSRYYDPEVGRFINADGYVSTGQGLSGYNMFTYCGNNPIRNADPSGNFFVPVILIVAVVVSGSIIFSGCSSGKSKPTTTAASSKSTTSSQTVKNVGSAKPYNQVSGGPDSQNCYTYALGMSGSTDPGKISNTIIENYGDIAAVAAAVQADMATMGRSCRVINGPNDYVADNERRIALRVTAHNNRSAEERYWLTYDYHFMVQTSTGQWAEKKGFSDSRLFDYGETPDTILWDYYSSPLDRYYEDYYDSEIYYFAIGD